jgi:hypothetical protein
MSKKSKQRKHLKPRRPRTTPWTPLGSQVSPAAQALGEKIARSGPNYVKDNFIRLMQGCYILRDEPEFRDLYFDVEKAAEASMRIGEKFEERFHQVAKASRDEQAQVYDAMRIEIIDELATPQFRQDVLRRVHLCTERLKSTDDTEKLEMALFLGAILEAKEIPWGLCGLITSIYEATAKEAQRLYHEEKEIVDAFLKAAGPERDLEKLSALPMDSPPFAAFTQSLKSKPGLRERLEREAFRVTREYEEMLARGEIELDLFTDVELIRPVTYMADYLEVNQIDPLTADPQRQADKFAEFIRRSIGEVMVKERVQQMKDALKKTAAQWLRAKNPQGAWLEIELAWLDSVAPVDNPFLYAGYLGGIHKLREQTSASAVPPQSAPASNDTSEKAEEPGSRRGFFQRVRGIFRKR